MATITGIYLAANPNPDITADQAAELSIEVQRAPDVAGSPGTPESILTLDPGERQIVDPRPQDGSIWHYRTRYIGKGYSAGAWTSYNAAAALPLPDPIPELDTSTEVVPVVRGGTEITDYVDAGAFPVSSGAVKMQALAAVAVGSVMKSAGLATIPVWGKITDSEIDAAGAIAVSKLAAGTDGQVLFTRGSTPQWDTPTFDLPVVLDYASDLTEQLEIRGDPEGGTGPKLATRYNTTTDRWEIDVLEKNGIAGNEALSVEIHGLVATKGRWDFASGMLYLNGSPVTGGGASQLDDLSDVTLTSPATGSWLIKTAGDWVDALPTIADIGAGVAPSGNFTFEDFLKVKKVGGFSGIGIEVEAQNAGFEMKVWGATTWAPSMFMQKAGGTEASPTAVGTSDWFGFHDYRGYDGNSFEIGARMVVHPTATWADASEYTSEVYWETTEGNSTTLERRISIGEETRVFSVFRAQDVADPGGFLFRIRNAADSSNLLTVNWDGKLVTVDEIEGATITATSGFSGSGASITGVPIVAGTTGTLTEARGGTGTATYTTGDLLYADATNSLAKLGIGAPNKVLVVAGGVPTWDDVPQAGVVVTAPSTSQIIVHTDASEWLAIDGPAATTGPTHQNSPGFKWVASHWDGIGPEDITWEAKVYPDDTVTTGANEWRLTLDASVRLRLNENALLDLENPNNAFGGIRFWNENDSGGNWLGIEAHEYGTGTPYYLAMHSRGTRASPSATQANDTLGIYYAAGRYTDAGGGIGGYSSIQFYAEENFTSTGQDSQLRIVLTKGSSETETHRVNSDGDLLFIDGGDIGATGGNRAGVVYASRFDSNVATGTAPFTVASTTVVSNLNADQVDGEHATAFARFGTAGTLTAVWTVGSGGRVDASGGVDRLLVPETATAPSVNGSVHVNGDELSWRAGGTVYTVTGIA